jgi:hypothetical protein
MNAPPRGVTLLSESCAVVAEVQVKPKHCPLGDKFLYSEGQGAWADVSALDKKAASPAGSAATAALVDEQHDNRACVALRL